MNCIKNKDPLYYGVLTFYNNFTPEQFALLLCGWYEVKEEYKVGDWIFRFNNYSQITRIENDDGILKVFTDKHKGFLYEDEFRKATAEEITYEKKRRFWDELGRRVEGYRNEDVVKYYDLDLERFIVGSLYVVNECTYSILDDEVRNDNRDVLVSFNKYNLERLKLVVPVEDRLDLK